MDEKEVSDQATPPKTAHVTSKASLYKPPTFEELQNLKETEMLFKSNLLKLQVYCISSILGASCRASVVFVSVFLSWVGH